MRAEDIAAMREELKRGYVMIGWDPQFLPRLLDEREALAKALSGLANWVVRNVSADFNTGDPPRRIEALAEAHRVLDQVSKP